jgi:hypothetical protein
MGALRRALRVTAGGVSVLLRRLHALPDRPDARDRRSAATSEQLRAVQEDVAALRVRLDGIAATVEGSGPRFAELRDSIHLVARRTALGRRPTRVLFLVHVLGAWDSYHALVEAMVKSDDFEPVVASIPRRFRGSNGLYGEDEVHRGLAERGVAHLRFSAGDLPDALPLVKAIEPDVIFRQSQWDADVPDEFGTARLGFARTCMVPYETMNIVVNVADAGTANTAIDSAYHRVAWLVFCANDMVLDAAVRDGVRDGTQFRVVGHPKADHLRTATPHWPIDPVIRRGAAAPHGVGGGRVVAGSVTAPGGRVVWSAHHTIGRGWTDFGTFHLVRDEMLAWARRRDDVQFVFMPHPALLPFPDSDASPISRAEFDAWMRAWAALPNTTVVAEADYGPTLAASDVMITDGLSMLVEYQLFTKPVIFFERAGHRPFNAIGERVVGGVHPVHTVDEVRELAEKFLGGEPDPLRARQQENVQELFGSGDSVARILDVLRTEIARERAAAGT